MVPPVKSGSATPTTTQEEQAIASSGGSRGMKRPLPQDDAVAARPPPKKAAVKSIAKKASGSVITPPTAGKAGLSAKTTAAAPAESFTKGSAPALSGSPVPKPTGQMRKAAPGAMEKKMAASPSPPSQANGPAAKADGAEPPSKVVASIRELLLAMKASPAGNKLRDAATLGNALAHNLPIDHIAVFLRSLKKKLAERGQREGVRVPVIPSRPTAATEESSLTAQTTTQVSASAATPSSPAPPPPQKQNQQQPKQPQEPQQPHQPQQRPPAKAISKSSPATDSVGTPPTPSPSSAPLARQVAKSKPASIPAKSAKEAQSMPPPSPPADSQSAEALIALVGEFTENPVCEDGEIKDGRLDEVLRRLWDGVARKPKDWMAAWQAMVIPVEKQGEALQKLLNIAFVRAEEPDKAPAVIAELVKNHKVKMRSVEEVLVTFGSNLDGILTVNEDAWKIYSEFLYRVFPKPAGSGWGWSRVGWSWSSWWQFTEKCVQSIESAKAFDIIALMLRLIQDREGSTLAELPMWTDGDKLQRTLTKLCELGSCSAVEVIDRLAILGVVVDSS
eukprot:TRINITY_DN4140_c0_g4_i1.p1 TRINITY_DN4140_c0_g4~~TRINITY_DN4140_c0_g4_i1.p1  ORF type:complete len:561 (-),score=126.54 TRINITY_DN4140_c0_g4_i1:124-1806(-)